MITNLIGVVAVVSIADQHLDSAARPSGRRRGGRQQRPDVERVRAAEHARLAMRRIAQQRLRVHDGRRWCVGRRRRRRRQIGLVHVVVAIVDETRADARRTAAGVVDGVAVHVDDVLLEGGGAGHARRVLVGRQDVLAAGGGWASERGGVFSSVKWLEG